MAVTERASTSSGSAPKPTSEAEPRRLRVAVVMNVLPHYRAAFFRRLFERDDLDVHVFCQASIPGMALKLSHDLFPDRVTIVPAIGWNREMVGWQRLPWRKLVSSFDVLFVLGNPRVLSNVILAGLARAMGRRVVIWGQAHTAGAGAFTERLRLWWWRRFDNLFVYSDAEARSLKAKGFGRQHVVGMNNGLDQRRIDEVAASWSEERLGAWRRHQGISESTVVLSCARLEPKNRYDVWLDAMPAVISRHPDLLWCVIGEGPERQALEAQARQLGLSRHVRWLGAVLDEEDLAPWFLSSRLLIHPGAIGLTLLHAFGYGLPVVTHDDAASHMPEFGAFEPGETGLVYRRGEASDLAAVVCRGLADEPGRRRMSRRVLPIVRERYNVQVMAERFVEMARQAARN